MAAPCSSIVEKAAGVRISARMAVAPPSGETSRRTSKGSPSTTARKAATAAGSRGSSFTTGPPITSSPCPRSDRALLRLWTWMKAGLGSSAPVTCRT